MVSFPESAIVIRKNADTLQEYKKVTRMHWQRLDRDNTEKVINSVKSAENEGMFSLSTSEVQQARVSFYKDYSIYKVTNFASLPSFTFQFLSDGTFFHYLDGTEDPIHTVNDKGVLTLTEQNILEYATFYFAQVGNDDGDDVIVVTNPHDMPLLDSLDAAAYDSVFNNYKPPVVTYQGDTDSYIVETDLYTESHGVRAKLEISAKGRVKIVEQTANMHQVMKSPDAESLM